MSYTANVLNQYTAVGSVSPTYDGNGNLTSDGTYTFGYDAENRLTSASGAGTTATYAFDAQGRRKTKTVNGTTYTVLCSSDAAAGNRYETTSYRVVRNSQCYVIEYTVHSTAIGNYDPSQGITEFDQAKVTGIMEGIVSSFRFTDGA